MFQQADGKTLDVKMAINGREVVLLPSGERSRCHCCNQRRTTVVNGVCLPCTINKKRVR